MIEEKKDEKEFDVIPASSDRNEVVRDNLQTEDAMKWCLCIPYDKKNKTLAF